jgi:hypothetical protein
MKPSQPRFKIPPSPFLRGRGGGSASDEQSGSSHRGGQRFNATETERMAGVVCSTLAALVSCIALKRQC